MNAPFRIPRHRQRRAARASSTRGAVLIVVLVICLGLVSLTLAFGHAMLLNYRGVDNELAGRQADLAIEGAARYAEALMSNATHPGDFPDHASYQSSAVPVGEASFWFIGKPSSTDPQDQPYFGLVDEASKLNLNTASQTMLLNLPGMTQDLAAAIVAWRKSPSNATNTLMMSGATAVKYAPFESVEELALVNGGTDPGILYGDDANLNHVSDPQELSGGLGQFNPGLFEYVTVFSREPNTLSDGTKRTNVTGNVGALGSLLNTQLGAARAREVEARLRGGGIRSVLEFYLRSGLTADEFDKVTPYLTMQNGPYSVGLINVNTAGETVLACVPGIGPDNAQKIVAARTQQAQASTNLAWVATILGRQAAITAGPYLTTQSYQVSADVAAVGRHGRGYRRTRFVIDASAGTPQIVYRRNLAALGWALGDSVRQTLANKKGATP
ncbi:MAG: helix-hairpin-helix domain-containing protein [Verrucomicrobia bacterium]|nr:helix-hairpin-helix domain-containing protein [Verrucomicrobiota bacterium]